MMSAIGRRWLRYGTGRGSTGLVRGGDERRRADEIQQKRQRKRVTEERVSMEAKKVLEAKEHGRSRT